MKTYNVNFNKKFQLCGGFLFQNLNIWDGKAVKLSCVFYHMETSFSFQCISILSSTCITMSAATNFVRNCQFQDISKMKNLKQEIDLE
jgi:SUMO ligase MMS21 Smc5/6 complex component